jgi:exoribonuclease-2
MTARHGFDSDALRRIARDAMEERGLLPEFSLAVLHETSRHRRPGRRARARRFADLRELQWASIDNDDSRDLDQLTVASLAESRRRDGPSRSSSPSPTSMRS